MPLIHGARAGYSHTQELIASEQPTDDEKFRISQRAANEWMATIV